MPVRPTVTMPVRPTAERPANRNPALEEERYHLCFLQQSTTYSRCQSEERDREMGEMGGIGLWVVSLGEESWKAEKFASYMRPVCVVEIEILDTMAR